MRKPRHGELGELPVAKQVVGERAGFGLVQSDMRILALLPLGQHHPIEK